MKKTPSAMPRCPQCKRVVRKGSLYIICAANPKHKQKQS